MPLGHEPWIPDTVARINNQKIAIVGYSHHRNAKDEDSSDFTRNVVQGVLNGDQKGNAFFTPVARYFGFEDKRQFWSKVIFFNFVPECIGLDAEKYGRATSKQVERGKARVLRILAETKPDKVFVFTTKGWQNFPHTDQEVAGLPCTPLFDGQKDPSWGEYTFGDYRVRACGFRHPQYASTDKMTKQVQAFLNLKT